MTRIETARVNEVIGLSIATIQDAAHKLNANCELQELEADIASLEKTIADLKDTLAGLPYKH